MSIQTSDQTLKGRLDAAPKRVLLLGGTPDRLNRNLAIRDCVAEALAERLGAPNVHITTLEDAADRAATLAEAFVLVFGSAMADESDYAALARAARGRGLPLVFWLTEDPYEFDAAYKFTSLADLIFTNDRWTQAYYRRDGVHHLPMAAAARLHFREVLKDDAEYEYDIFFCGVGFANRRLVIDGLRPVLARYNTLICGAEWVENASYVRNVRLSTSELMDHYRKARIVLNLGRDHAYANDRYRITPSTPGPRLFEAALAGGFQMILDDRPEVMDYYAADREIVLFSGLADFAAKASSYLQNPARRMEIAGAAQARTLREHLYVHRVDNLLARLSTPTRR